MRGLGVVLVASVSLAGCGGGDGKRAGADAPLCSPRSTQAPCTEASIEVDYRVRVAAHCGVGSVFLDGRWWRIDPVQPEGVNWLAGTARLLGEDELSFRSDDGRRYAFAPAPPGFQPPPCY